MSDSFIEVQDREFHAVMNRVVGLDKGPLNAFLQDLSEGVVSRIKRRFVTGTDPEGNAWKPLAQSTYEILANRLSKSNLNKDGRVNSKGASKIANKKILIGESRDLSRQWHIVTQNNTSLIFNSMVYSGIHNWGGMAGRNRKVKIPARPYSPVKKDGQLYPQERVTIIDEVNQFIQSEIQPK